jgi:hypothetical protein
MAEQSTVHHWINTAIAGVALVASGVSSYFAFNTDTLNTQQAKFNAEEAERKREDIGISPQFTLVECPFVLNASTAPDNPSSLGLCWKLFLYNSSIETSDIKKIEAFYSSETDRIKWRMMDTPDTPATLTIYSYSDNHLGTTHTPENPDIQVQARNHVSVLIQAMTPLQPRVAEKAAAFKHEHSGSPSLQEFVKYLRENGNMDLSGNNITGIRDDPVDVDPIPVFLVITTTKDKQFGTSLRVPFSQFD